MPPCNKKTSYPHQRTHFQKDPSASLFRMRPFSPTAHIFVEESAIRHIQVYLVSISTSSTGKKVAPPSKEYFITPRPAIKICAPLPPAKASSFPPPAVSLPTKETVKRCSEVPVSNFFQVFPPSSVRRKAPSRPTAKPV